MNNLNNMAKFISRGLVDLTNSWPVYLQKEFRTYYSNSSWKFKEQNSVVNDSCNNSFWLIIPLQLFEKYQKLSGENRVNIDFLYNTLWSQYCIFMSIRIRDDLLDSTIKRNPLFLISDLFMIESEKIFRKYFSNSSKFWKLYNSLKLETLTAMHEKEYLESKPDSELERILECHGLEGAVLSLAAAAICSMFNKLNDFDIIKKITFNLVITGQIIDDLFDIEEDLYNGYDNYIMRILFPSEDFEIKSEHYVPGTVFNSIFEQNKINLVIQDLNKIINLAEEEFKNLKLPIVKIIIQEYKNYIFSIEENLKRRRIEYFFQNQFSGFYE